MIVELDGRAVSADAARVLALGSYGHFTAMQVRNGATRGLARHIIRLDAANRELFDVPLDGDRVRTQIRHALGDRTDASVRVYVFGAEAGVSLLVTVREPAQPPDRPQLLRSVPYQRPVAHIKHLGGFAQDYHRRRAHRDGFDEVLLTGSDGVVSEGGITNVGFLAGSSVVWPDAPALQGITMQLLQRAVPSRKVTVRLGDLAGFDGAFVCNSRGVAPVARIDDLTLPASDLVPKLIEVYGSTAWDPI